MRNPLKKNNAAQAPIQNNDAPMNEDTPAPIGGSFYNNASPAGDVYAPPSAQADIPDPIAPEGYNDGTWSSLEGRIGRIQFLAFSFLWSVVAVLVWIPIALLMTIPIIGMLGAIVGAVITLGAFIQIVILIPRRRLHDLNRSGWFVLLSFVPFIQTLFWLYCVFAPGDEGFNDYGKPPQPYTKAQLVLAAILPVFYILVIIYALIVGPSAYNDYLENLDNDDMTIHEEVDASIKARVAEIEAEKNSNRAQDNTEQPEAVTPASDVQMNDDGSFEMDWTDGSEVVSDNMGNANSNANSDVRNGETDAINTDASSNAAINQSETEEAEVEAAIEEALVDTSSTSTEMSLEEFMNMDSQIMVE